MPECSTGMCWYPQSAGYCNTVRSECQVGTCRFRPDVSAWISTTPRTEVVLPSPAHRPQDCDHRFGHPGQSRCPVAAIFLHDLCVSEPGDGRTVTESMIAAVPRKAPVTWTIEVAELTC